MVHNVIGGVDRQIIPSGQYLAVLVDEGHDFAPEWLKLVTQMVDPTTNSLLLLYDDAQSIYDKRRGKPFSFKSVGVPAQGRTTILKINYRNTRQILQTASAMPANHRELFDLAVLRLLDYKHHLEDGNDSTASVVINAERETVLRNLIGAWCNDRARGRYVIPQELKLPDAKRPDLWWTCTAFNGPVPTELKIADNWSGPELFERLENQLADDYLRDDASVRGIYLLVWRGMQKGWQLRNKKWVNFAGLVEALHNHWSSVTRAQPRVEEIKVVGIDLTKRAIAPALAKKASTKKAPAK
ncbi:hypothetical protein J2W23_001236 [Variovorax boronicumulans]|nr:hypothetical protein [Variovorax boronicumulans]